MLLITIENFGRTKERVERVIHDQFLSIECAICCNVIDQKSKGVVYITCGGMADLEHVFCVACDERFKKQDPYKRTIEYRFEFPFANDAAAEAFVERSRQFVLNEGDDAKIKEFQENIKQSYSTGYEDLEVDFDLFAKE
jgi:hypothetical protein